MTKAEKEMNEKTETELNEELTEEATEEVNEESKEETAEAEAEKTAEDALIEENEALKAELEAVQNELAEKADLHLRLQAEFDNFRRRTVKEKEDLRKTAAGDVLGELLPVLDNFDRALIHAEDSPILEGIVMVQKQMLEILERAGLEKLGKVGEVFDPNFHDAIMQEPSETAESGTILEVLQPGYSFNGKLLRAAMVKVAQ